MDTQTKDKALRKPLKMSGSLEIVEEGIQLDSQTSTSSSRPLSSGKKAPPIISRSNSASNKRSTTPVKEKTLITVKRKSSQQNNPEDTPTLLQRMNIQDTEGDDILDIIGLNSDSRLNSKPQTSVLRQATNNQHDSSTSIPSSSKETGQSASITNGTDNVKDSSSSEESSDEEETRKAPNQLIMEFLQCVMADDLENSLKLCKMILLYEPTNSQALKFLPLLEEKKLISESQAAAEGDSSEDESSDEDDDDDDDDDADDDDEDSDESDSDEEDEEGDDNDQKGSK